MRALVAILLLALPASAAEPPLVEKYLHSGQLAIGEQVLERELKKNPKDDQLRFGLGVIRLALGVERMSQTMYEYGAKADLLFIRIHSRDNPEPNAITYEKFRGLLDDARRGLIGIDATLAGITDDDVKLPLRLARIKLDLDGDGVATDDFSTILVKFLGGRAEFLTKNPDFLVHFDRGDVAWLRSYCHVAAGAIDFLLSLDLKDEFELNEFGPFPKVRPKFAGTEDDRKEKLRRARQTLRFAERARLTRVREHFVQVAKLNRETWRYIRAETDNDHEWLPNPKQTSVIGLPVTAAMVDGWLEAMAELEAILEGKKLLPIGILFPTNGKGLNLKTVLDDPPASLDLAKLQMKGVDAKYLENGTMTDLNKLIEATRLFDGGSMGMYMAYFN
jgi:hypothetical protein